ncbi:DNA cytosine methyltransferase [Pseudonocardia sp. GCM10023141]|uniref:DNA cytosine methyltransferase n=1 Tax=Pseudonocardia sp. GCM10023141 TaxID=3252653 RepID=UPI0036197F46
MLLTDADWLAHQVPGSAGEFLGLWRAGRGALPASGIRFIDFFCGAGGEAQGLVKAGLTPVLAANHWEWAIRSHETNHPNTDHFQGDLQQHGIVEALPYAEFFWASPSCPAWSQANGEARTFDKQPSLFSLDEFADEERELYGEVTDAEREKSRALMWDVPRYLDAMQRREGRPVLAGVVENVIECRAWTRWDEWVAAFRNLGYSTRLVALNSMHADAPRSRRAPQSRDRLYFTYWHQTLRRDPDFDKWLRPTATCTEHGQISAVQTWKRRGADMGRYRSQYTYRCPHTSCRNQAVEPFVEPAAVAIDPGLPTQRIGDRAKPLAAKTMARIVAGRRKYWTQAARGGASTSVPLLVPTGGTWRDGASTVGQPMPSRTARENDALVTGAGQVPLLVPVEGRDGKAASWVGEPLRTQTARNETALVVPPLVVALRNHGRARPAHTDPLPTFSADGFHQALVMRNNSSRGDGAEMCTPLDEPLRTLTTAGHQSVVEWTDPHLFAYDTGQVRSLATPLPAQTAVRGDALLGGPDGFDIDDCTLRMLEPAEIGLGMAFAPDYVVLGNKRIQARQYGNAVTPPVAELLGLALREAITGEDLDRAPELGA